MTVAKNELIEALRVRYDHYSAFAVFEMSRQRASLADKDAYERAEVAAFRAALVAVGDRVQNVLSRIDGWLESSPAATSAAPSPTTEAAPAKGDKKHKGDRSDKAEKATSADAPAQVAAPAPAEAATPASDTGTESDAPAAASTKVATTIALTGVEVKEGDEVVMCGAGALGDWDPAKGTTMTKQGDAWIATIELPPDAELAFKFLRRTSSGKVIWEAGDNRILVARPRVDATWR